MAIQAELYPEKVGFAFSGPQDFMLENGSAAGGGGGGLASDNHFFTANYLLPPQDQLQYQQQQMKNQALFFDANTLLVRNANLGIDNNAKLEGFQFQATFQDKEIDQFMRAQNARLRVLLHEQRKREMVALMKEVEARSGVVMREKDGEIAKATRRWMELENLLGRLEMEKQGWQKVAQEKEAMMISLNNAVEEMRERASVCFNNSAEDAESWCEETGESRGMVGLDDDNDDRSMAMAMACRVCKSGNSCVVVFLPCRHLCSCKQCQVLVDSCPVCGSPKKSSIEVLIS